MDSKNFENLVKMGMLKPESENDEEVAGLVHSGQTRLKDAGLKFLSEESRFDNSFIASIVRFFISSSLGNSKIFFFRLMTSLIL